MSVAPRDARAPFPRGTTAGPPFRRECRHTRVEPCRTPAAQVAAAATLLPLRPTPPPFKSLPERGPVPSPPPHRGGAPVGFGARVVGLGQWRARLCGPGRHLCASPAVCAWIAPRDPGARRVIALALRGPVPGCAATDGCGVPWLRWWPGHWPPGRWWSGPWPSRRRGVMRTPPGWPAAAVARAASRSHRASLQPRGAPPRPWTRWAPTRRGPWTASTGQRSCRALVSTWSACSARAPLAECTWSTTAAGGAARGQGV